MTATLSYRPAELAEYINWLYFFHAWGMPPRFATVAALHNCPACRASWVAGFGEADRTQAAEAARLFDEARKMLGAIENRCEARVRFGIYPARSDGDDILIYNKEETAGSPNLSAPVRLPMLRQQRTARPGDPYLSLADFVHPGSPAGYEPAESPAHFIGIFAATVEMGEEVTASGGNEAVSGADEITSGVDEFTLGVDENRLGVNKTKMGGEKPQADDPFRQMLCQTLCDRLAEAAVERMHEQVRRKYWGYAPQERLTAAELFAERFQGIRPAVGYPSLPDQSLNFVLDGIIGMGSIGIRLTENGMMNPHASVSGLMLAHPQARYFAVGPIDEQQLADYARRRGMPPEAMRKYLAANLRK